MQRFIIVGICGLLIAWPAHAGIFGKKNKPTPQQVAELVNVLLNHPDAGKRAEAAEELADADAATHPEVVHALIEALRKDGSSTVRRAAASSLGKLQPRSREAAEALDHAIKHDDSWTVRMQARMARLGYRVPEPTSPAPPRPSEPSRNVQPLPSQSSSNPTGRPSQRTSYPATQPTPNPANAIPTPESNPLLPPNVNPSNLELAPPPRLQSPSGSHNQPQPNGHHPTGVPVSPPSGSATDAAKTTIENQNNSTQDRSSPATNVAKPTLLRPTRSSKPESVTTSSPQPNKPSTTSQPKSSCPPELTPPTPPDLGPILVPPPQ